MSKGLYWKSRKFELFDERNRPIAVVYETEALRPQPWGWFIIGQDDEGSASSLGDAMGAVERVLNVNVTPTMASADLRH